MQSILDGFAAAFRLIISLNPELWRIILLSIEVSGTALILATVLGLPVGAFLALRRAPLRSLAISLLNTGMGLPPVAAGLFLYLFLSRSGPLGFMGLLYTPTAMIIAQCILAFPIVASLSHAAIARVDPVIRQAAKPGGHPHPRRAWRSSKRPDTPLWPGSWPGWAGSWPRWEPSLSSAAISPVIPG